MKIAIIGSRSVTVSDLTPYVPHDCSEIVSGGARGVDLCAAKFAKEKGIKLTEFLPNYKKYGRSAPLLRNKLIVEYADSVIAFWTEHQKARLTLSSSAKNQINRARSFPRNDKTKKKRRTKSAALKFMLN